MTDTSPAPSRREQRRVRTRRALLDAAERLVARDGFHVTTVEDLAAGADVPVSSLYNSFPGGEHELFLAVVEQAVQANRRSMDQAYRPELTALEQVLAAADVVGVPLRSRPMATTTESALAAAERLAQAYGDAWNAHDLETILALHAPGMVFRAGLLGG